VEDLDLETLQGVDGLRALRVAVNLDQPVAMAEATAAQSLAGR
jgi:hypothetical protein